MKRKENEQTLKQVLDQLVGHYRRNDKFVQAEVKAAWEKVIGTSLAKRTKLIFLKNRTLSIYLESAVLKEELSFGKQTIMANMNQELGYNAIEKVEIY